MDEKLHFVLTISNLELHCALKHVSRITFTVRECFEISFVAGDFSIHDSMVKSTKRKQVCFEALAKRLEFLDFVVCIWGTDSQIAEVVSLKLHAVCEGPQHHDHLLKEMKARVIYNLEITQVVSSEFSCSRFEISEHPQKDLAGEFGFSMELVIPELDESSDQDRVVFFPKNPQESEKLLAKRIPLNLLKKSVIKVSLILIPHKIDPGSNPVIELDQFWLPYLKFLSSDHARVIEERKGNKNYEIRKLKHEEMLKTEHGLSYDLKMEFQCRTSRIYLEQMDCLVFSESGFNAIPPHQLLNKPDEQVSALAVKDLAFYEKELKKFREVTYQSKSTLQKTLKECCQMLKQKEGKKCHIKELEEIQSTFLSIIGIVSNLITEGEEVTNEAIWNLIDKIIHRPEFTTRYLSVVDEDQKVNIGLKHFEFMAVLLKKIIHCTEVGLTYHELKCIQKFIAYAFFRSEWIRELVVRTLSRADDPIFTPERLMEIGVFVGSRSPSKAIIFDWEHCMNLVKRDPRYRKLEIGLCQTSSENPEWAELIFNREDQDLFYGLLMEIWSEAEIFLSNQGRIQWEYFPCYAELLGAFLGEMNRNQLKEYSTQFRECSIKLISNERLLNSFVALLFPKTCLYETYCVIKCLELLKCYFEAISLQKKKIPAEFNFNYFYTGIKSIFESNHSYLLLKVISLLYDYYHIFSSDFKKSLDMYIFDRNFYRVFLHWCGHVRRVFYLLLEHRIASKFRGLGRSDSNETRSMPLENISRMHQYHGFLEKMREEEQLLKERGSDGCRISIENEYFRRMQAKISGKAGKNVRKTQAKQKEADLNNSCHDSPQVRKRLDSSTDVTRFNRKWSVNIDDSWSTCDSISEEHKKYIPSAMREHQEIKNIRDPDAELRKIMKRFEGGKSVDS